MTLYDLKWRKMTKEQSVTDSRVHRTKKVCIFEGMKKDSYKFREKSKEQLNRYNSIARKFYNFQLFMKCASEKKRVSGIVNSCQRT